MAIFGSDWLDDYDSINEYETHIGRSSDDVLYGYDDKPIGAPIHLDEEYDSMKEYEKKLH